MKKSTKTEIVIPTWAGRTGPSYWGVHTELTKAVDALGIKRAIAYHGVNEGETFEPVGIVLKRISDCVDERLSRMKQRQAV